MNFLCMFKWVTYSLVLVGAINWGLIGAFDFDLVSFIFGDMTAISRVIYSIIGLSAIGYFIFSLRENMDCAHYNW